MTSKGGQHRMALVFNKTLDAVTKRFRKVGKRDRTTLSEDMNTD